MHLVGRLDQTRQLHKEDMEVQDSKMRIRRKIRPKMITTSKRGKGLLADIIRIVKIDAELSNLTEKGERGLYVGAQDIQGCKG